MLEGHQQNLVPWWHDLEALSVTNASVCVVAKQRLRPYKFLPVNRWFHLHHYHDYGGATTSSFQIGICGNLCWNPSLEDEQRWELNVNLRLFVVFYDFCLLQILTFLV